METKQKADYRRFRTHGISVSRAARQARLTTDQAMRLEGKRYCESCGDYVRDEDCVHWDYES